MEDNNTTPTQNQAPAPAKEKKKSWFMRHKVLTVILVIVVIAVAANGGKDKNGTSNSTSNTTATSNNNASSGTSKPEEKKDEQAKIGTAVRDGKFEFTVNKLSCGETSVGSEFLKETAQGQFCRVNVTVKNIGDEAQTLSHSDQVAYNASGQKYKANSTAAIYASSSSSSSTWYNDINPGNSVTGDIFFDVPKDVTPTTVELHDSAFSGGVKVSLQ